MTSNPPLCPAHTYVITLFIFFVQFGFGLLWLCYVKVLLIVLFLLPVCCVRGVSIGRGLFFLIMGVFCV